MTSFIKPWDNANKRGDSWMSHHRHTRLCKCLKGTEGHLKSLIEQSWSVAMHSPRNNLDECKWAHIQMAHNIPTTLCMFIFIWKRRKIKPRKWEEIPQKQKFKYYWKRFVCSNCIKLKSDIDLKDKTNYLGGGEAFLDSSGGGGGGERPRLDNPAGLTKPY